MKIKQQLYDFCQTFVEDRIFRIQKSILEIQESLSSETKSSAGDKHETGRAMLQLEREKLGHQLAEAEKIKQLLNKVEINKRQDYISLGSLVQTRSTNYFIAISAGEFKYKGQSVYCISAATPIGRLLMGKKVKEVVFFNKEKVEISKVL